MRARALKKVTKKGDSHRFAHVRARALWPKKVTVTVLGSALKGAERGKKGDSHHFARVKARALKKVTVTVLSV